jgi:hypothetical protein
MMRYRRLAKSPDQRVGFPLFLMPGPLEQGRISLEFASYAAVMTHTGYV